MQRTNDNLTLPSNTQTNKSPTRTLPTSIFTTTDHIPNSNHNTHQTHDKKLQFRIPKTIQTTITYMSDNEFIGDETTPKDDHTIRIFYANVDGISPFNNYENFQPVLDHINQNAVDIACITEHNLSTDKPKIRYELQNVIKRHIARKE